jgi:hypothetical protein
MEESRFWADLETAIREVMEHHHDSHMASQDVTAKHQQEHSVAETSHDAAPTPTDADIAQSARLAELEGMRAVDMTKALMKEELGVRDPLKDGQHLFNGKTLDGCTKYKKKRPDRDNGAKESEWREWLLQARLRDEVEEPPEPPPKRRKAEVGTRDGDASNHWNMSMSVRALSIICDPAHLAARTRLSEGFTKEQHDANKHSKQNPLQSEWVDIFNDPNYVLVLVRGSHRGGRNLLARASGWCGRFSGTRWQMCDD